MREVVLAISTGLTLLFVAILFLSVTAYFRVTYQKRAGRTALPRYVMMVALAFIIDEGLSIATIYFDSLHPAQQFPYWLRVPWHILAMVLAIAGLGYFRESEKKQL